MACGLYAPLSIHGHEYIDWSVCKQKHYSQALFFDLCIVLFCFGQGLWDKDNQLFILQKRSSQAFFWGITLYCDFCFYIIEF